MDSPGRLLDVLGMTLPVILDGQEIIGGGSIGRIDDVRRLIVVRPISETHLISTLTIAEVLEVGELVSCRDYGVVGNSAETNDILAPSVLNVRIGSEGNGKSIRLVAHESPTPILCCCYERDAGRRTSGRGVLGNLGITIEDLEHGNLQAKGRHSLHNGVGEFLVKGSGSLGRSALNPGHDGNEVTGVIIDDAADSDVENNILALEVIDGHTVVKGDDMLQKREIHIGSSLLGDVLYIAYRDGIGPGEDTVSVLVREIDGLERMSAYSGSKRLGVGANSDVARISSLHCINISLVSFGHVHVTGLICIKIRHRDIGLLLFLLVKPRLLLRLSPLHPVLPNE